MVTVINTHEVADFNAWKQIFDAGAENRTHAGINVRNVYRAADNANKVTVISEVADVAVAKAFIANLRPALAKAACHEAHTGYPVPRYMTQKVCEDLIRKALPKAPAALPKAKPEPKRKKAE